LARSRATFGPNQGEAGELESRHSVFVEANDYASPRHDHRPADQIRLLGHQSNRLFSRRRMLFHTLLPEKLVVRVQEVRVITLSDELFKLCRAQPLFCQVAKVELEAAFLEKLASFPARGAIGLVQKLYDLPFSPLDGRSARLLRWHFWVYLLIL